MNEKVVLKQKNKKRSWSYITLFIFFCLLNSCALVPFINSYKQMGVTANDRKALLQEHTRKFNKAYSSNQFTLASQYVADEYRQDFLNDLRNRKRKEKLVDSKVDFIDINEDARECTIDVVTRYYQVPFYVVKDRLYQQKWKFSSGSWKLHDQKILKNMLEG